VTPTATVESHYSGVSPFIEPTTDISPIYIRPISPSPILGVQGPRILARIQDQLLPVLLDTGADVSVISTAQLNALITPPAFNVPKTVKCFGGNEVQ